MHVLYTSFSTVSYIFISLVVYSFKAIWLGSSLTHITSSAIDDNTRMADTQARMRPPMVYLLEASWLGFKHLTNLL